MKYRSHHPVRACIGALCLAALAAAPNGGRAAAPNQPSDMRAHAYQFRVGAPGSFIRIQWDRPDHINSNAVLDYVIWRGDPQSPAQIIAALDGDTSHCFIDNEASRNVTAYDGPPNDGAGRRALFLNAPGIIAGEHYVYQVANAYQAQLEDRNMDGLPDRGAQYMSPLSVGSRFVTALAGPTITAINGQPPNGAIQVNLRNVAVEWSQTPGADTYVIAASASPQFRSRVVLATVRSPALGEGGTSPLSATVNAAKKGLSRKSAVFLSVGARRSGEPKPQPFGAIYGPIVQVTPETGPPGPPGSSAATAAGAHGHRKHHR